MNGTRVMDSYLLANAESVVARARAGDETALDALVARYRPTRWH